MAAAGRHFFLFSFFLFFLSFLFFLGNLRFVVLGSSPAPAMGRWGQNRMEFRRDTREQVQIPSGCVSAKTNLSELVRVFMGVAN